MSATSDRPTPDGHTPFRVQIEDGVLDDLRDRLARTRWPDPAPDGDWAYGSELGYVRELCEYWRTEFDWRAAEARLNEWPQFMAEIDGESLHYLHVRSPHADALPLVMTHGWPGSVSEFLDVIGPLTDPAAHGGDPRDAFHLVCPSMPGYGFSGPTRQEGWNIDRVSRAVITLMAELGYDRYGAQGGDWGAISTARMGLNDPEHIVGIHLNMAVAGPPDPTNPMEGVEEHELADLAAMQQFSERETGYQQIQGTKPQTLAYGLMDSPAGLAAWIVEKFRTWTDCDGDVETALTKEQMLTDITIYWATGTIGSSMRLYRETRAAGMFGAPPTKVQVPTGVAMFPHELYRPPRAWIAAQYDLVHHRRFERGGHFAAMEQPDSLIEDVRDFFRPLR
ncbi:MAG: epoxide hydrolase [Ilumatobacteraceae bacterium]